ncbi:MBL fold metallo-hydrolase [Anaerosinus massiliensis]|uniref:MBL fold metallo-hydrolase n=1 Tax=Massilibacillus massiliensis TaxID=1806837 RepID=UPI000A441B61|nr:MBL fold metallo-hydrolase [Massilibacillus massiliensis]
MRIEQLVVGQLSVNCYIVSCENTKEAMVIDPGDEAEAILDKIEKAQLDVKYIVNTHGHADHIGANTLVQNKTNAVIAIHGEDAPMLDNATLNLSAYIGQSVTSKRADRILQDGDTITIGDIAFSVLHTPGHTKGGICLLNEDVLFSGDTLFSESIGRTDFPGGSMQTIIDSIQKKLLPLPDHTKVYPGHGSCTTIGWERVHNQFL